MIYLLNTYCLDHVYPQQMEQKVDTAKVIKTVDINIENSVKLLQSVFKDLDKNVIEIVLIEQSWGDINNAIDILATMSKENVDKQEALKIVQHGNIDLYEDHDEAPYSGEKLMAIVKSNTHRHLELSEHESTSDDPDDVELAKSPTILMLDNLITSFK